MFRPNKRQECFKDASHTYKSSNSRRCGREKGIDHICLTGHKDSQETETKRDKRETRNDPMNFWSDCPAIYEEGEGHERSEVDGR
jgi:hypothetical protein